MTGSRRNGSVGRGLNDIRGVAENGYWRSGSCLSRTEGLIRITTAEGLLDEGFDVVEASDGDEALALLDAATSFDILLTDVRMPGLSDGVDVAIHFRRLHPEVPVIVVSGYAPHLIARLKVLNPAAVYIGKPYTLKQIVEAVRRLTTP